MSVGEMKPILKLINSFEASNPHKVVCLVGSTSPEWQEQYRQVNRELCLKGYIVVSVSLFKTDVEDIEKYRNLLESIHFQKIRISDAVVLIHKDAIGTHTQIELEYCRTIKKPIGVFSDIDQTTEELRSILEGEGGGKKR